MIVGRRLRSVLDIWPYVSIVYGVCFVMLLVFARRERAGARQPPREMAIFLALAIGPMLFGHTGLNWALKYLPAYVVRLDCSASRWARPSSPRCCRGSARSGVATVVGGLLVLLGIFVAARSTRQERFAL